MNNNNQGNLNFDLEDVIGRSEAIREIESQFGKFERVMCSFNDGLMYLFENSTEAILYAIHRFKEVDYQERITLCEVGNLSSVDSYVHITTEEGSSCIIKRLCSYEYRRSKPVVDQQEIDYFLAGRSMAFQNDQNAKLRLMKSEVDHIRSCDSIDTKIKRILDRYFGDQWEQYWFTNRQLSKIAIEVTLNVLLRDQSIIRMVTDENNRAINKYALTTKK